MTEPGPTFFGPMLIVRDFGVPVKFYRDVVRLGGNGTAPYAEFGMGAGKLVLLDHDETHLHDTVSVLDGPCHQALVDINDRETLFEVFERFRPDVVLHTAAHKHVPVLEDHPVEAARTNVFGTLNVIEASAAVGVTVESRRGGAV